MVFLGITLCLCSYKSLSVDPTENLSELHHTQWTARDGAPTEVVALAQTRDGYLWLASSNGLFRFDGLNFERYTASVDGYSVEGDISALWSSPSGELWIGMRFGGIFKLQDGHVVHYGPAEGLPMRAVRQIISQDDGTIWAQTQGGLYRQDGNRWKSIGADWHYPPNVGHAAIIDGNGTLWSRGVSGTFYLQRGSHSFQQSSVAGGIGRMGLSRDGRAWVSDRISGLLPLTAGAAAPSATGNEAKATGGGTGAFLFDREGGLWIIRLADAIEQLTRIPAVDASSGHPLEIDTGEHLLPSQVLSSKSSYVIFEDREENVWISTSRGIDRFRSNKLHAAVAATPAFAFMGIVREPLGSVWLANQNILMNFESGKTGSSKTIPISTADTVSSIYGDPDGSLWLGQERKHLARYKDGHLEAIALPGNSNSVAIHAITRDGTGSLWIASIGDGLYRFEGGSWRLNGGLTGLPDAAPITLTSHMGTALWVGYSDGSIVLVDKGQVTRFTPVDGLNIGPVLAISESNRGLWAGGPQNVALLDSGHFWTLHQENGSAFSGVSGIIQAKDGSLWLNGSAGISHINQAEITAFLSDHRRAVHADILDYDDGLNGTAAQSRPLPTAIEGGDGKLWFSTTDGVFWIDPNDLRKNTVAPTVHIRAVKTSKAAFTSADATLPAGTRNFEIDYTAASLSFPQRIRFRYRLDDVDTEWQSAGARRQAYYTNISPGEHKFHVMAENEDGLTSTAAAEATIIIPRLFYETRWFHAIGFITGLSILALLYQLRLRGIHARLGERAQERERIARELHDTLIQSAQGLILIFQGFAGQLPTSNPMRKRMEIALDQADDFLREARERVFNLRATSADTDLLSTIARLGEECLLGTSVKFSVDESGATIPLRSEAAEDIFHISREALLNVRQHSGATSVMVTLGYTGRDFRLVIRDDGLGIDPTVMHIGSRPNHFGLQGMRERARLLGGRLQINSAPGAGTQVGLTVPARYAYRRANALIGQISQILSRVRVTLRR